MLVNALNLLKAAQPHVNGITPKTVEFLLRNKTPTELNSVVLLILHEYTHHILMQTCARGSIQEHAFGLSNTQSIKQFWVLHWQFNNFLDFLNLFVQSTNHLIG